MPRFAWYVCISHKKLVMARIYQLRSLVTALHVLKCLKQSIVDIVHMLVNAVSTYEYTGVATDITDADDKEKC